MTEVSKSRKRQRVEGPPTWFLYPPKNTTFQVGQAVLYRSNEPNGKGRGYYCKGLITRVSSKEIVVKDDSSKKEISMDAAHLHRLLLPDWVSSGKTIVVTPETNEFRRLVGCIHTSDRVLEIGCSSGEASKLMVAKCKSWVGFDTSEEMLKMCRASLDSVAVSQSTGECHAMIMNALVDPKSAREEAVRFGVPTVVVIDIGGNRELLNVLRMISWVLGAFDARLVLIKSRELTRTILSSSLDIDSMSGLVGNCQAWFQKNRKRQAIPKHPQKAPLVMSPVDPNKPICRYFNYHKKGCIRDDCSFDHEHCHFCLGKGHIGRECPGLSSPS